MTTLIHSHCWADTPELQASRTVVRSDTAHNPTLWDEEKQMQARLHLIGGCGRTLDRQYIPKETQPLWESAFVTSMSDFESSWAGKAMPVRC